ncbi:endoplasmic reticulum resident protein 27 isoform X2 [Brachyhypopomus gauderio]|uniref:endoplasmic reticulum resident protein 27 isoform X2 n=1 Tax=Brachyhypopomus gauderio TaxID=698409 RepID=UPI0040439491
MLFVFLFLLMLAFCTAADKENALPRLTDISAAASFIGSAEVVVVGFFETDGGHGYKEFLAAAEEVDLHQEHLQLSKIPNLDTDGVVRFFTINNIRFITEYNPVSAVGLFQSKVKVHLVLMAHRGSSNYKELKGRLEVLAPQYAGKLLFVLVNGKDKANARVLDYFRLKSRELPRVGLYDGSSDQSWLMAPGEISADRVRNFCDSFLSGELQKEKVSGEQETRTEL